MRFQQDDAVAGVEVPVFDAEQKRVTCVCGGPLRLLRHGAVPMIDSSGGPYNTYGIWACHRCKKEWIEDEYDGWQGMDDA